MDGPKTHPTRPARPTRAEPREVAELKRLRADQPELADAVDLQVELLALQHRVQARIPLPWIEVDPAWLKDRFEQGRPMLRFEEVAVDWTELRLMFRQAADLLRRHDALDEPDYRALQALSRTSHALEPLFVRWYAATSASGPPGPAVPAGAGMPAAEPPSPAVNPDALEQVLGLAMRPFLERCAESLQQRIDLSAWREPFCPLCGGEPEFAVITPAAQRVLVCSRCAARWPFDPLACPFCLNADRARITSFASRDGRYRLYACDKCRRYVKAYDGRTAQRPFMLALDSIATLPLDAAAIRKGYRA